MKTNKRPQLVIVLASLTLGVREIVSQYIQNALFSMGYHWSHSDWRGEPEYTQAQALYICSHSWNPRHVTYGNGPVAVDSDDGNTLVFDASQVEEFLAAAKVGLVEKRTIQGVDVLVTPENILVDPSALLASVTREAAAIQLELWG